MATNNGDFIRAAVRWDFVGAGDVVNVYQLRVTGAVNPLTDDEVREGVLSYMTTLYQGSGLTGFFPDELNHVDIFLLNLTQNIAIAPIGSEGVLDGTNITDPLPSGVSALILGRTSVPRRVARKYLPPFTDGDVVNGLWTGAAIDALEAFGDNWILPVPTGVGFTLQAWVGPDPALNISPITSYSVRAVPAYQRRRKAGVGS